MERIYGTITEYIFSENAHNVLWSTYTHKDTNTLTHLIFGWVYLFFLLVCRLAWCIQSASSPFNSICRCTLCQIKYNNNKSHDEYLQQQQCYSIRLEKILKSSLAWAKVVRHAETKNIFCFCSYLHTLTDHCYGLRVYKIHRLDFQKKYGYRNHSQLNIAQNE